MKAEHELSGCRAVWTEAIEFQVESPVRGRALRWKEGWKEGCSEDRGSKHRQLLGTTDLNGTWGGHRKQLAGPLKRDDDEHFPNSSSPIHRNVECPSLPRTSLLDLSPL